MIGDRMKRPVTPWFRNPDTYYQILLVSIILVIFLIFAFQQMAIWQTVWVFINITFGYAVLSKRDVRKKARNIWLGAKEPKVWGIAFLNLFLVIAASVLISIISPSSGEGGGNPFVSSLFLVVILIPIIPLFADAETTLFQGIFFRIFMRKELVKCSECGTKGIPSTPCRKCGRNLDGEHLKGPMVWIALFTSAAVFAGAHMLLLWSIFPAILFIGGILLGIAYLRKGHMFTAKVHLIYDLVLILMLLLLFTLEEFGGVL